jgi:ribonuclease HI
VKLLIRITNSEYDELMAEEESRIVIYTDGSALGNPGPGGFGIVLQFKGQYKEVAQGYRLTTNNRMELLAIIVALEMLKVSDRDVIIYSDSKYVIDSVTKGWVFGWVKKGFAGKKNADLWKRFLQIYPNNKVRFEWVKGHANNPGNERCDALAVWAANQKESHLVDDGYEADQNMQKLL